MLQPFDFDCNISMGRREILRLVGSGMACFLLGIGGEAGAAVDKFAGEPVFKRIVLRAKKEKWAVLPIGELMGRIALELEHTPYVANTLELSTEKEFCSVNLNGLDCVTFFETTLDLARIIKKGRENPDDLLAEIAYTRYVGGKVADYSSRLHYTTDWFLDNEKKGVVRLLKDLPGATAFPQKLGFMSGHPQLYRQLVAHPELVNGIKAREAAVNSVPMVYYPSDKIAALESFLKTGDIVGLCTGEAGLDIAHTGLVIRTGGKSGTAHFMDASSRKAVMKVVLEPEPISQSVARSKKIIGAMFARPLEPVELYYDAF